MTDELDEINQILMCFEKYSWKEFGEHYPVNNQKSMNRTEAKQAINAYILGEVMELLSGDEQTSNRCDYCGMRECCGGGIPEERNNLRQELRNKANKKWGEL